MAELTFSRLARADFALLARWLETPHVARRWNHETSPAALERDYGPTIDGDDSAEVFIVALHGQPIGLIQRYTFADNPAYRDEVASLVCVPDGALSMDYFVGEAARLRRGLAGAMVEALLRSTWVDHPRCDAVIVPVVAANEASLGLLARCGLREIARGPLTPDNPVDDSLHVVWRIDRPADTLR